MPRVIRFETPKPGPWPGMLRVGDLELRPGEVVPLYESEPPEGRRSINTPEGWNALVERMGWRCE